MTKKRRITATPKIPFVDRPAIARAPRPDQPLSAFAVHADGRSTKRRGRSRMKHIALEAQSDEPGFDNPDTIKIVEGRCYREPSLPAPLPPRISGLKD